MSDLLLRPVCINKSTKESSNGVKTWFMKCVCVCVVCYERKAAVGLMFVWFAVYKWTIISLLLDDDAQ